MFDLKQLIGEPTRVTDTSPTIIDLVLVSEPSQHCQSDVTNLGPSDHMLTYCTRKVKKSCVYQHIREWTASKRYDQLKRAAENRNLHGTFATHSSGCNSE